MPSYRIVSLAQTGIYSVIHPMVLRSLPHDYVLRRRRPHSDRTYISQPEAMDYRQHPHCAKELTLSRSGTLIRTIIRNPATASNKQEKRQYMTKIESYYASSDAHWMWQGLQTITD